MALTVCISLLFRLCLYVIHVKGAFSRGLEEGAISLRGGKNACLQEIWKAVQESMEHKSTEAEVPMCLWRSSAIGSWKRTPSFCRFYDGIFTKIYAMNYRIWTRRSWIFFSCCPRTRREKCGIIVLLWWGSQANHLSGGGSGTAGFLPNEAAHEKTT